MKVILLKDVINLGDAGDIKEVADGYARNYLLPRKFVLIADDKSKKIMDHQKKIIKIKKEKRRKLSEKAVELLTGVSVKITVQVGEEGKLFGSVTSMDIAKKLKEQGHEVDKRKIILDAPLKNVGEYDIPVKLDEGLTAKIKVIVETI